VALHAETSENFLWKSNSRDSRAITGLADSHVRHFIFAEAVRFGGGGVGVGIVAVTVLFMGLLMEAPGPLFGESADKNPDKKKKENDGDDGDKYEH
jgi:hypothetical protein